MLGQWPYITHGTIARQYAQAKTAAPLQHDAPPERHITRRVVTRAPAHPATTGQSRTQIAIKAFAKILARLAGGMTAFADSLNRKKP
jgi:hypothetical protein